MEQSLFGMRAFSTLLFQIGADAAMFDTSAAVLAVSLADASLADVPYSPQKSVAIRSVKRRRFARNYPLKGKLMTKLTATFLFCIWTAMIASSSTLCSAQDVPSGQPAPDALAIPDMQVPDMELPDIDIPNMEITVGEEFGDMGFDLEGLGDVSDPNFVADAPPSAEQAALATGIVVGAVVLVLLAYLLIGVVAYLLSSAIQALPEANRPMPAWVPWLLLVPLVQIVVFVLAFIQVPKAQSNYLSSIGDTSMGDCGASNGLWGVILYLLGCTFPIGLVLLVMSMLKINQATKIIKASPAA